MSDRDEQLEALIREIAEKHGIMVGRDDPIFVLQTINSRLMQDSARAQRELLDRFKQELEELASRWGDDAKEKAERILTAALGASKDAMRQQLEVAARTQANAVQTEIEKFLKKLTRQLQDARHLAMLNVVAACATMVAAAVVLIATIN